MKAHIVYDADGTTNLVVKGPRISTQLFDSGKALIRVYRGHRVTRSVQLTRTHSIDFDKRRSLPLRDLGTLAAGLAVGAVALQAARGWAGRNEGAP